MWIDCFGVKESKIKSNRDVQDIGKVEVPYDKSFSLEENAGTQGHDKRLFNGKYKQHLFTSRVVDKWNRLDEDSIRY